MHQPIPSISLSSYHGFRVFRGSFLAVLIVLPLARGASANPEIPGAPQEKPVAIVGATIHPVSGPAIERGTIVFDKGKITAVGKEVMPPPDAEVIRLEGKHVYPGLFDAGTNLGLVEINSVRATIDVQETGSPSRCAAIATRLRPSRRSSTRTQR